MRERELDKDRLNSHDRVWSREVERRALALEQGLTRTICGKQVMADLKARLYRA